MRFSGVSALAIWNNATRTLTGFNGSVNEAGVNVTTIAAAASVDSRSSAAHFNLMTVAVKTGAAATAAITINIWDGTTAIVAATTAAAANASIGFTAANCPTRGIRITNTDGANAGTFVQSAYQLNV